MKKLQLISLFVFILGLTSSCVFFVNTNGYSDLNNNEKAVFSPFSFDLLAKSRNPEDSFSIYEITAPQIKQITKKYKYTWVHFWAPYCKSSYCTNTLGYMCNLKYNNHNYDIATVLISSVYDVKDVKEAFRNSALDCQVFVLNNTYYGENQNRGMRKFSSELDNNSLVRKNRYFSNYFFRDTLLVYASWDLDGPKVDSLLKIYNH